MEHRAKRRMGAAAAKAGGGGAFRPCHRRPFPARHQADAVASRQGAQTMHHGSDRPGAHLNGTATGGPSQMTNRRRPRSATGRRQRSARTRPCSARSRRRRDGGWRFSKTVAWLDGSDIHSNGSGNGRFRDDEVTKGSWLSRSSRRAVNLSGGEACILGSELNVD